MSYIFGAIFFCIICYIFYIAYENTKDIKINKIKVSPTEGTHQQKEKTLSILHLSDLHLENISLSAEQLAQKTHNEQVDMIVLTGDFLDRKRTIPKLIPYLRVLRDLKPTYGCYAVFGNHDYVLNERNLYELKNTVESFGCRVLQNENDTIFIDGQQVNIIGIDDYSTNRSNLSLAFEGINKGTNIILTHDPTVVLDMEQYHFDYLMAGHFHGGQICYPKAYHLVKMGKLARKNIIKGLHIHHQKKLYISEGLGQTGLNIRLGSRPEITFHHIGIC